MHRSSGVLLLNPCIPTFTTWLTEDTPSLLFYTLLRLDMLIEAAAICVQRRCFPARCEAPLVDGPLDALVYVVQQSPYLPVRSVLSDRMVSCRHFGVDEYAEMSSHLPCVSSHRLLLHAIVLSTELRHQSTRVSHLLIFLQLGLHQLIQHLRLLQSSIRA